MIFNKIMLSEILGIYYTLYWF